MRVDSDSDIGSDIGTRRRAADDTWARLGGDLPAPGGPGEADDVLWQQLQAQFRWYDREATRARLVYYVLKVLALVLASAVTVLAAIEAPGALTAALAAGVVVLEAVQQVFQFHSNWISYRTSAEALRQHAFLYVAEVGPYAERSTRRGRLAETVHTLTSGESAAWASTMRHAAAPIAVPGGQEQPDRP